ncbi:MAG: porin family protein [Longimicrobiales bacterium]|nr:porin family protein [Longimicrobiales bacterium]
MKKLFVSSLALLLAMAAPASAQRVIGFHGGLNISDLGADANASTETGANIGASILFPLSGRLGLHLEASYSEKGAEADGGSDQGEISLDYLEFPVLLRYGFPTPGNIGFHVYGGGALSFELDCELSGGGISDVDCKDVGFDTNTTDFGLMAGAGLDYGVGAGIDLVLDAFYNYGLRDIDDSTNDDVKNRTFTIRAGVAVPLR